MLSLKIVVYASENLKLLDLFISQNMYLWFYIIFVSIFEIHISETFLIFLQKNMDLVIFCWYFKLPVYNNFEDFEKKIKF